MCWISLSRVLSPFRMSLVEGANAVTINVLRVSAVTEELR